MNKVKSYFIILVNKIAAGLLVYVFFKWRADGFGFGGLGLMITAVTILAYTGGLYLYRTPRTSRSLYRLTWIMAVGAGISLAGLGAGEAGGWVTAMLSVFLVILWELYVFWYSRLDRGENQLLAAGKKLPEFVVEKESGTTVSSHSFHGRPALFMFYRGNWCPLCMAQIREVAGQYQALDKRGVQVVLVSPQPHDHTRKLAQRFRVPFHFLVDRDNRAARQLGIAHKNGLPAGFQVMGYQTETVYPTVIITDASGIIRFANLTDNYRIRPEPRTFLRVLDEMSPAV